MSAASHPLLGVLLERRYRIDAPIARGGMSIVYRGLDVRLDRPVAIKVMDPKFAADPAFLARFEFEARAVAKLKHAGLVAVYDQGVDNEHAFLVMELVEGGTLRELLRERGPMPPHAATAVAAPVLDALGVAHVAGLVHRDIKPENVLISDTGEIKIADFGLVRAVAAAGTTSSSVILGTAAYLSPEQVTTGNADARSDVYSTGILVFEMLTGRTPFTGDNTLSIAYQRINADVPRPGSLIPGVPREFDEFVRRATERDPAGRFPDANAMSATLRGISRTLQLPSYRVPAPQRSAEHQSAERAVDAPQFAAPPLADPGQRNPQQPQRTATALASAPGALPAQPLVPPGQPRSQRLADPLAPINGPHPTRALTAYTSRHPMGPSAAPPHATSSIPQQSSGPPGIANSRAQFEFPDFHAQRRRSRRSIIIWILVVLLVAVVVGVGGWWLGSGRFTSVPTIVGLDRAAAESAVAAAGLEPVIKHGYSNTAVPDDVLGIDPTEGTRIPRGSEVTLQISLGRPAVPDFARGASAAQVQQQLRDRTFVPVDGDEVYDAKVPRGGIVGLEPTPGTILDVGSNVHLKRSKGPPPVDIPDVRGRTEEEARALLTAIGIKISSTRVRFDAGVDAGRAIGTDPDRGQSVPAGSSTVLVLSNAIGVPDLTGLDPAQARTRLTQRGLVPVDAGTTHETDATAGTVGKTEPAAGTRVDPGNPEVKIFVSDTVKVPAVTGSTVGSARDQLTSLGFNVKVRQVVKTDSSLVFSQSPAGGSRVAPGSTVTLTSIP